MKRLWKRPWLRLAPQIALALWGLFCAGAVYYNCSGAGIFRWIGFALVLLPFLIRSWRAAAAVTALLAAVTAAYMVLVSPSNTRDWQPPFSRNPVAEPDGSRLIFRNVRNFHYRSETDFDADYIDFSCDPEGIEDLSLVVVHWGSEAIAHTMISFRFRDGGNLVFSMETRLDKQDVQGALPGLFRQFELLCIAGTERDLLGLRTNFRHEDVYLYPLIADAATKRRLLLAMADKINRLAAKPEFYNTLTSNCTTALVPVLRPDGEMPCNCKLLLNGFSDLAAYDTGILKLDFEGETFEQLKLRHYVNPKVDKLNIYAPGFDYSAAIREGF